MKAATAMREVARIAEMQDGLVTTRQAVRVGVPRLSLARLAESDDLERLTHGVYRVRGADEDEYTGLRAAWLAADPGRTAAERAADLGHPIVVSHRSAAAVHGIGNMYADRHELTAPVRKQSRRSDVMVHRADVPRSDITIARGMMVTTIERTIADLARTEPELGDVADALAGAYLRGAVDLETLAPMLDAAARRHGASNGSELLERMLELRGLDATSALAELARQPYLSRLLGAAWAPVIQSALQEAVRDAIPSQALRDMFASSSLAVMQPAVLEALKSARVPEISSAMREAIEPLALPTAALADMARVTASMGDVIAAPAGLEAIKRSLTSPAVAVIARDLGRYNDMARLARQATAGLPSGLVSEATQDE